MFKKFFAWIGKTASTPSVSPTEKLSWTDFSNAVKAGLATGSPVGLLLAVLIYAIPAFAPFIPSATGVIVLTIVGAVAQKLWTSWYGQAVPAAK